MPDQDLPASPDAEQRTPHLVARGYQGPLPPVEDIERWRAMVSNAPDRFLSMLEDETYASIRGDQQLIDLQSVAAQNQYVLARKQANRELLGQVFAFLIAIIAIGAGVYTVSIGQPIPGTFFGGFGVASLAGVFVYRRREERKNGEAK